MKLGLCVSHYTITTHCLTLPLPFINSQKYHEYQMVVLRISRHRYQRHITRYRNACSHQCCPVFQVGPPYYTKFFALSNIASHSNERFYNISYIKKKIKASISHPNLYVNFFEKQFEIHFCRPLFRLPLWTVCVKFLLFLEVLVLKPEERIFLSNSYLQFWLIHIRVLVLNIYSVIEY